MLKSRHACGDAVVHIGWNLAYSHPQTKCVYAQVSLSQVKHFGFTGSP